MNHWKELLYSITLREWKFKNKYDKWIQQTTYITGTEESVELFYPVIIFIRLPLAYQFKIHNFTFVSILPKAMHKVTIKHITFSLFFMKPNKIGLQATDICYVF